MSSINNLFIRTNSKDPINPLAQTTETSFLIAQTHKIPSLVADFFQNQEVETAFNPRDYGLTSEEDAYTDLGNLNSFCGENLDSMFMTNDMLSTQPLEEQRRDDSPQYASGSSVSVNNRNFSNNKRKICSVASDILDATEGEKRNSFKRSKVENEEKGYAVLPFSSSSLARRNLSTVNIYEWCAFNPEVSATKYLAKIIDGSLDVKKFFPNGFEINDKEWRELKPLLPTSITNLEYPRELINTLIEYFLHGRISSAYQKSRETIKYSNANKGTVSVDLRSISKDFYKIKRLICMKLPRFHGYLSTKFKLICRASSNSIKKSFNQRLHIKINMAFSINNLESVNESLSAGSKDKRNLTLESVRFLVYLGVGGNFDYGVKKYFGSKTSSAVYKVKEFISDIVHNTNIIISLDSYVLANCPELKKYWIPHMI